MAQPSAEALVAAVNALYRIRAVEQAPGEDGLRSVWHQCSAGADLISYVNEKGQVVRQELTLLSDYFRWSSQHGLITGHAPAQWGRAAQNASADLALDPQILPERVIRASQALESYRGEDRYLRNIQRVLNLVVTGLQSFDEVTVTRSLNGPPPREEDLEEVSPAPRPRASLALAIGLLVLVAALGGAMLLMGSR